MDTVLKVVNLTKSYGKLQALKGISFEVKKGEIFALIGPNGAGKTTTLRIISTILKPDSGEITLLNHDIIKNSNFIREKISYLPEEAGAYKTLTGLKYLTFMANIYYNGKKDIKSMVEEGIAISNLKKRIKNKIGTYSKGMVRKLLLARTVMAEPELAILDEPTSGLDVINAFEIRKLIKEFAKKGMSVLLSSHNMLEIEFLSDRVAFINKGEILEIGEPSKLKEKYKASNLEEVFVNIIN